MNSWQVCVTNEPGLRKRAVCCKMIWLASLSQKFKTIQQSNNYSVNLILTCQIQSTIVNLSKPSQVLACQILNWDNSLTSSTSTVMVKLITKSSWPVFVTREPQIQRQAECSQTTLWIVINLRAKTTQRFCSSSDSLTLTWITTSISMNSKQLLPAQICLIKKWDSFSTNSISTVMGKLTTMNFWMA